ncbi:CoA transferase [Tsukamurella sp. 8F]|uniref:CaiB/BaiF CoA transferase family protein n=1 Tax=unclassified Tsukamurella TaxID=2633480 RepID=UPI0023BA3536|nr:MULTISPECIES: CoA transferase [unclassified Tsukamurella]MDF0530369.1 CoA transferase [Tsukamurella sp. 8J]MDF0587666.1 CoA transferase [Tsukamurella sp. 8F]
MTTSQIELGAPPTGPLAGVRIVDLSTVVMGPMATQVLGDMGADVVRVEPPFDTARNAPANTGRNPGMAPLYMQVNRNKRSVALNLKTDDGHAALMGLLADADVLVTNMRAGALERLGIAYDQIAQEFPKLVYAHAQGFNAASEERNRPAYDEVVQAVSGLVDLQRRASGSLQFVPTYIADKTASLYLVSGVLGALYERERSGEGQLVSLAMADALIAFNTVEHMAGEVFAPAAGDVGNPLSFAETHAAMATADGRAIAAVPYTNDDVRRLLVAVGADDLAADPRFLDPVIDREFFYAGVQAVHDRSDRLTLAEWEEYLTANDMPYGRVVDIAELPGDPYVREMQLITEVDHPTEGRIRVSRNPLGYSRTPVNIRRLPERAGESTESVLGERRAAGERGGH